MFPAQEEERVLRHAVPGVQHLQRARERERDSVCVRERERECVSEKCVGEREKEGECV